MRPSTGISSTPVKPLVISPFGLQMDGDVDLEASSSSSSSSVDTVYLHDMVVDDSARGRGVGGSLLETVYRLARNLGVPALSLTAICGASRYWELQGFSRSLWTVGGGGGGGDGDGEGKGVGREGRGRGRVWGGEWPEAELAGLIRRLGTYPNECGEIVMMRKVVEEGEGEV